MKTPSTASSRRRPGKSVAASSDGHSGELDRKLHSKRPRRSKILWSSLVVMATWLALGFITSPPHNNSSVSSMDRRRRQQMIREPPYFRQDQNKFDTRRWNHRSNSSKPWNPLGTTQSPYSEMTPQMDVIWARGWYNAIPPPRHVPLDYYNRAGLDGGAAPMDLIAERYFPPTLCGPRWMRINDVARWIQDVLPQVKCHFTLITSDGIIDVPNAVYNAEALLDSRYLVAWYAQNVVDARHPKLHPIPVGLPIHYGFPKSPHSAHTLQTLLNIRQSMPAFATERSSQILLDIGTTRGGGARGQARLEAAQILRQCPHRVQVMEPTPTVETWTQHYRTHQFAVVIRGTGWDTYRTWEYLLLGTVPILLEDTPIVQNLHLPAHVPIVTVANWTEICQWTNQDVARMVERYQGWIDNAFHWLRPSLWVPRNQTEMERLCDVSPGCRETSLEQEQKRRLQKLSRDQENAVPTEEEDTLGLDPQQHQEMLRTLLRSATSDELEQIIQSDPIAKEKMYQQLLLSSQAETIVPTDIEFERCLDMCEELRTESVVCTFSGQKLNYACREKAEVAKRV